MQVSPQILEIIIPESGKLTVDNISAPEERSLCNKLTRQIFAPAEQPLARKLLQWGVPMARKYKTHNLATKRLLLRS